MPPEYRDHPIPTALRAAVQAFWSIRSPAGAGAAPAIRYRVLPDGCVDLLARFAPADSARGVSRCDLFLTGLVCRHVLAALPAGVTMWGLQFRPGWVEPVLGVRPDFLPQRLEPARGRSARLAHLAAALERLPSREIGAALRDRVAEFAADAVRRGPPTLVRDAVAILEATRGKIGMGDLAGQLRASDRTLRRQLARGIGMPAKAFARILRFRHAVERLEALPLAELALEAGYFDQAHLTNEFRALAGVTPAAFVPWA